MSCRDIAMKDKFLRVYESVAKKGVFPHQLAFTLLIPFRSIFLSPKRLVSYLELKRDYRVLEVGPGPGYFSVEVARAIPDGELVLTDIQEEMLAKARARLTSKRIPNVEYHLCDGEGFPFKNKEFDVIYMVTVLGEVENRKKYAGEFFRMLRPGGILSVSEQAGDPDKMSVNEIKGLFLAAGFEFNRLYGTEKNFTVNFRKEGR